MNNYNCVFLTGGPGSGKDFVLRTALKESGATEISLSKIFKAIKEFSNLPEVDGRPLIINGDALFSENVFLVKNVLESMNYDTSMVYVYTTDEKSRERNEARMNRGDKTFNEEVRQTKYTHSTENMFQFKEAFGESFFLFDNSNDFLTAEETVQNQVIAWLKELSESVEKYHKKKPIPIANQDDTQVDGTGLKEDLDVLFEKQYPTIVDMIAQKTGKREGDKYKGGIAVAGAKSTQRTTATGMAESNQEVTVPQTQVKGIKYSKNRPAKGAKPPGEPLDSRIGTVPSGGIGLTAYHVESFRKVNESHEEWTHEMSGKEALDAGHVNKSMFKGMARHKPTAYLHHIHPDGPKYSFRKDNFHIHHVHVRSGEHHIDYHMTKHGKVYSHHAYKVTDDPNGIRGKKYSTLSKSGYEGD